jgi:hypothetical protein
LQVLQDQIAERPEEPEPAAPGLAIQTLEKLENSQPSFAYNFAPSAHNRIMKLESHRRNPAEQARQLPSRCPQRPSAHPQIGEETGKNASNYGFSCKPMKAIELQA